MYSFRMEVRLRSNLQVGDIERIISIHDAVYRQECDFDATFASYVAEPLKQFAASHSLRDRIWLAERGQELVGCVAIVGVSQLHAQLRWFLVNPAVRGQGLGRRLLQEAVAFCRECEYQSVFLWTVSELTAAAHLYRAAGFELVEQNEGEKWGKHVVEQRYECRLQL